MTDHHIDKPSGWKEKAMFFLLGVLIVLTFHLLFSTAIWWAYSYVAEPFSWPMLPFWWICLALALVLWFINMARK